MEYTELSARAVSYATYTLETCDIYLLFNNRENLILKIMAGEQGALPPFNSLMVDPFELKMSRRGFGLVVGLGALAAFSEGRDILARHYWPDEQIEVARVRECRERQVLEGETLPPRWLANGGLGRQRNLDQAERLAFGFLDVPYNQVMAGGLNHPNQGIYTDENAACVSGYIEGTEGIKALCHSMGTLTFMETLLAMPNPPHVDEMIIISGLRGLNDVKRKDEVRLVVESGARGDVINKFFFNLLTDHHSPKPDFLDRAVDVVARGMRNARTGVSPMVYVDQLHIIARARIMENMPQYRGIFTPRTKVISCITPYDGTLHYRSAANGLWEFFTDPMIGADFSEVEFKGRHADTRVALATAREKEKLYGPQQ